MKEQWDKEREKNKKQMEEVNTKMENMKLQHGEEISDIQLQVNEQKENAKKWREEADALAKSAKETAEQAKSAKNEADRIQKELDAQRLEVEAIKKRAEAADAARAVQ